MRIRFFATAMALIAGLALPGLALSATVQLLDPVNGTSGAQTIFSTLMKRDKNLQNNGQSGPDVFLYDQTGSTSASQNINWAASGTTYNWAASYDGTNATLTFGSVSRTLAVGQNMTWNAFKVYLVASDPRFVTATTRVTVDTANGGAITNPLQLSVTNTSSNAAYALIRFDQIASLSGTLRYSFQALAGARGSPEDHLAFVMEAVQLAPTGIPVPAALPMMLGGLAALGALVRRKRRTRTPA